MWWLRNWFGSWYGNIWFGKAVVTDPARSSISNELGLEMTIENL